MAKSENTQTLRTLMEKANAIGRSESNIGGQPNFAEWVKKQGLEFEDVMNFISSVNRNTLDDIIPLNVDLMFELMEGKRSVPKAYEYAVEKSGPYLMAALGQVFMVGVIAQRLREDQRSK